MLYIYSVCVYKEKRELGDHERRESRKMKKLRRKQKRMREEETCNVNLLTASNEQSKKRRNAFLAAQVIEQNKLKSQIESLRKDKLAKDLIDNFV